MRYSWWTVAGWLLVALPAGAQQPPGVPPATATLDPAHNRLDALLLRWAGEMGKIDSLEAQCTRMTKDKTFQDVEIFEGRAKYLKPNMALLEMQKKGKADVFEKYICSGTFLYEYVPASKVIRVHELPPSKSGQVADDNFLSFLFGMKAEDAKQRYDLKLTKEDENWIYLEILPRVPADKADFQRAQLVLSAKTFLPRRLWFEQPNGNEITWDLPRVDNAAHIARTEFVSPAVPPGWSMVRVPRPTPAAAPQNNVPPTVYRPQMPQR